MTSTHSIEQSILCSVIENSHIGGDKKIIEEKLIPEHFTDSFHVKITKAINRLKELDEPIDTDYIRMKFMDAKQWGLVDDNKLIELISHTPFGTYKHFKFYIDVIAKKFFETRLAI